MLIGPDGPSRLARVTCSWHCTEPVRLQVLPLEGAANRSDDITSSPGRSKPAEEFADGNRLRRDAFVQLDPNLVKFLRHIAFVPSKVRS